MILPPALYGCEILAFALREEYRLRMFENGVLRKMLSAEMSGHVARI
jgi:hypothetical protein